MEKMGDNTVDLIVTSPPYNSARIDKETRYDVYNDFLPTDEYCRRCVDTFNRFDKVLKENGVVLWNVSYGTDLTNRDNSNDNEWLSVADIIRKTRFCVADKIVWKKRFCQPNNSSNNKLSRIVEDIFVFCRKSEIKTFHANKVVKSTSRVGQKFYNNLLNFIEADNNDGPCELNKATFSSELVEKLLEIYAKDESIVFDPYMGSGTTAIGVLKYNQKGAHCHYVGSEISAAQVDYANRRIERYKNGFDEVSLFV